LKDIEECKPDLLTGAGVGPESIAAQKSVS